MPAGWWPGWRERHPSEAGMDLPLAGHLSRSAFLQAPTSARLAVGETPPFDLTRTPRTGAPEVRPRASI